MVKARSDGPITLSIIDRLVDHDPKNQAELPMQRAQSLREFRAAVRRDLEWLLNTRQPVEEIPEAMQELRRSVYNFGLPDITSANLGSSDGRTQLILAMERALAIFEPRLANVRVSLNSVAGEKTPQLRFAVEAMLRIDPSPEQVSFDGLLELSNGEYKVQG